MKKRTRALKILGPGPIIKVLKFQFLIGRLQKKIKKARL